MVISKQKQMCGPFHAMVVNPNVVGERMKILWYALYLKSWLRWVLFSFTLDSSSVCLVFLFTSLESKNLKMFISKNIFYQQGTLDIDFSMIIEQHHNVFPHVRLAGVIFFMAFHSKFTVHKAKGHNIYMCKHYQNADIIRGRVLYEEICYT